jgi:hypothetical protein
MSLANSVQKGNFKPPHRLKKTLVKNFTFGQFLRSSDIQSDILLRLGRREVFPHVVGVERDATIQDNHSVCGVDAAHGRFCG